MKVFIFYSLVLASLSSWSQQSADKEWQIASPDEEVLGSINLNGNGKLSYQVFSMDGERKEEIIGNSPLGIVREDQRFESLDFITAGDITTVDEPYERQTGKRLKNRNHYRELVLSFKNTEGSKLDMVFRAYNNGIAFKYVFPENSEKPYVVKRELSGFKLSEEGLAWMQPYDTATAYAPAYERNYEGAMPIGTEAPGKEGWCFPALFETNDHWVLLTEADLKSNFYGSHLDPEAANGLYTITPPEEEEAFGRGEASASSALPWGMPWRVIMVGDELSEIVESNLVSHLSEASKIDDPSWVIPGRASWGWWSGYLNKTSDTPEKLRKFIDFAQEMGWEYSLIDAGWYSREGLDLEELVQYADDRGVGLLLWYNSGGPINQVNAGPRDFMYYPEMREKEMKRISDLGVKGVKIDFFGSDKQEYIQLYHDILEDAAKYKLMVNFHGSTIPRGWSRTYPNLISMESVKGSEGYIYHADFEEHAPMHNTILPYTRNVIGPMDYTPAAFSVQQVPHRTSYGHELALSVVFESGIQHFPDTPEVYLSLPQEVQNFLKQVPAAWDDTKFVTGYPAKEAVIARKKDNTWFVGGINGEDEAKSLEVDFQFLGSGNYEMKLIKDGVDNTAFSSSTRSITSNSKEVISLLPIGGFVMMIKELNN